MSKKLRGGVCDARCQQFHREVARKEERLRSQWFEKNKQRLYDNLGVERLASKTKTAQQQRKKVTDSETAPTENFRRQTLPSWRPPSKVGVVDIEFMRPIKPAVKDILYVPKDESFASKKKYLEERYKEKPEDRYYYPYCSSWILGWRLKDYPAAGSAAEHHGVRSVIQSSFYRRNASSLQRDPDWYRICQTGDPKNFNEILTY